MILRLKRRPDWRGRLIAVIDAWTIRPASEPDTNCGFFAADCVLAMTDTDFALPLRGKELDLAAGMRTLRDAGYHDILAFVADHLPEVDLHPSFARVGDLAVVDGGVDGGPALGVVNGATIAVMARKGGIGFLPLDQAVRAFRVG